MALTLKLATGVVNAMLDAYEQYVSSGGTVTPIVRLRSGIPPASCAASETPGSVVIASFTLATDFMAASAGGIKVFNGIPLSDPQADAAGNLGYYRIYNGATCVEQGTITATGAGGDMTVDDIAVTANQPINITAWSKDMAEHA